MEITRSMLLQRQSELLADLNAIHGALQNTEWLLRQLDADEPEAPDVRDLIPGVLEVVSREDLEAAGRIDDQGYPMLDPDDDKEQM